MQQVIPLSQQTESENRSIESIMLIIWAIETYWFHGMDNTTLRRSNGGSRSCRKDPVDRKRLVDIVCRPVFHWLLQKPMRITRCMKLQQKEQRKRERKFCNSWLIVFETLLLLLYSCNHKIINVIINDSLFVSSSINSIVSRWGIIKSLISSGANYFDYAHRAPRTMLRASRFWSGLVLTSSRIKR